MRPYLFYAKSDPQVASLLRGIIARMGKYLQIDPYANAFTLDYRVWEEKFELDSLAYPITLAWTYWKETGDTSIFTGDLSLGFDRDFQTMQREQDHAAQFDATRTKRCPSGGHGNPVKYTGMIWTGFRPSDDACQYNFLIPSEMMAVVALGELSEIERDVYHNLIKAQSALALRDEVHTGIQTYGEIFTQNYGYVYAYEVDGLGHATLMDDANIPSLLSAPYIGYTRANSFVYRNTRRFLLSKDNPNYYIGKYARGIGSLHTNDGYVWPLAHDHGRPHGAQRRRAARRARPIARTPIPATICCTSRSIPTIPPNSRGVDFGWPNALFSEYVMTTFNGSNALPTGTTSDLDFRGE